MPDNVAAACRSQYSYLQTACLQGGSTTTYSFQDLGWYGKDPVFYNRSKLFNPDIASK